MSEQSEARPDVCRNCGRAFGEAGPDSHGWCERCRGVVVRRATTLAVLPTVVVAGLYLWLLSAWGMFDSRFVIVWLAIGAALAWVAFKVARRVLFDVVKSRGVSAAPPR